MTTPTFSLTLPESLKQAAARSLEALSRRGSIALCTIAVLATLSATASARQTAPSSLPGHRVAVIDVAHIFKNLPSITAQVSKVESELKKYDAEFKQRRNSLKQSAEQLQTLKIGTADYTRQEEQVASLESKLRLDMARKHKELRDAEARIYFDNYKRITAAVKAIATHNNIHLVLRFNGEEMTSEHSELVARGIMKNVVYHDSGLDMTRSVMQYLEQQSTPPQIAGGNRATPAIKR